MNVTCYQEVNLKNQITTVINLFGESGAGKSTLAAELYAKMKKRGLKVELVREFAKELAWDGRVIGPFDQIAIIGEQMRRESSLFGKVDYIITDSPAMLGAFYMDYNHNQDFMTDTVSKYISYARYDHDVLFKNIMVERQGEYEVSGRYETEAQANQMRINLKDFLWREGVKFNDYTNLDDILDVARKSLAW
jgi:nicotinamide riboside kinase